MWALVSDPRPSRNNEKEIENEKKRRERQPPTGFDLMWDFWLLLLGALVLV